MHARVEDLGEGERHVWWVGDDDEGVVLDPPAGLALPAGTRAVVRTAAGVRTGGTGGPVELTAGSGLAAGDVVAVAGVDLHVVPLPQAPDAVALYAPALRTAFTGDAGPSGDDEDPLLALPPDTLLRPRTGRPVTVEAAGAA